MEIVTARVDEKVKKDATKLAHKLGINLSNVVNIYLRKFIADKGVKVGLVDTDPAYYKNSEYIDVNEPAEVVLAYLENSLASRKKKHG